MVDLLIKNGIIITMDAQRRIIDGGSVAVEKDRIVDVGLTTEVEKAYSAKEEINAQGMLVLPGMINTHTHAAFSFVRGLGDDIGLFEAHHKIMSRIGWHPLKSIKPKYVYHAGLLSCLEFIKTGSTFIVNQDPHPEQMAKAVEEAGIRGAIAPLVMDCWMGKSTSIDSEKVLEENVRFIKSRRKDGGRVFGMFGPVHELYVSKQLLAEIVEKARDLDAGIYMHLAETLIEVEEAKRLYGKRSIEYAYDMGVLRPGTILGHCCWLSEREISLIAKSGATVSHTPTAEMKLSDGITPVPRLLEAGANVGLGTDAPGQCNGTNDIIREMKTAALLHKVNYPLDPGVMPAERCLELTTVNGAKAVRMQKELGSLEAGKKADMVLINMKKPHLTPIFRRPKFNVVSLLVYSAKGDDVDTVIVNGKLIMLHGEIKTLDEAKVLSEAQVVAEEMVEDVGIAQEEFPWLWSNHA